MIRRRNDHQLVIDPGNHFESLLRSRIVHYSDIYARLYEQFGHNGRASELYVDADGWAPTMEPAKNRRQQIYRYGRRRGYAQSAALQAANLPQLLLGQVLDPENLLRTCMQSAPSVGKGSGATAAIDQPDVELAL